VHRNFEIYHYLLMSHNTVLSIRSNHWCVTENTGTGYRYLFCLGVESGALYIIKFPIVQASYES
jgi:hypothetical protein